MYKCCVCRYRIVLILVLCFRNTSEIHDFHKHSSALLHTKQLYVILKKSREGESKSKFTHGDFIKLFISRKQTILSKLHDHTGGTRLKIWVRDT